MESKPLTKYFESEEKQTSKTIVLTGKGKDKMAVEERPIPEAKEGEVLVHIQATGLNFSDLMSRQGLHCEENVKLPTVMGMEGAGVVSKVGPGVEELKVGDRVMCLTKTFGMWTEHASVPQNQCFPIPEAMSFEEAAAFPVNYIAAYNMLFDMAGLKKGQSVLVHMAAGGVGTAATQLCQTVPEIKIFGTASQSKHETMLKMGVDHPIDYRNKDYVEEIRALFPEGVDIVLDPLSGKDSPKGFDLLKPMGKIVHYGGTNFISGPKRSIWNMAKTFCGMKNYNPIQLMTQTRMVAGYDQGQILKSPEKLRSTVTDLIQMYQDGKIKPRIDSVWAFEDVGKAMDRMHGRENIGKVILSPKKEAKEEN